MSRTFQFDDKAELACELFAAIHGLDSPTMAVVTVEVTKGKSYVEVTKRFGGGSHKFPVYAETAETAVDLLLEQLIERIQDRERQSRAQCERFAAALRRAGGADEE